MALTATATEETKENIVDALRMKDVYEVSESPNKSNITYIVSYKPTDSKVQDYLSWIVVEIKREKLRKQLFTVKP